MSIDDILNELDEQEEAGVATPASPSSPRQPQKPSMGIGGYALDIGKGVLDGGMDAIEEVHEMGHGVLNWLDNKSGANILDDEYRRVLPDLNLDSTAGDLASGITKFAVGMIGAGKIMKGAKILQGASKATKVAHTLVQGALTDFAMNDPGEDRLSNIVESFPALRNPITDYLAADEDEGMVEGKLKAALEGMVISGATDLFMKGIKVYKGALKAGKASGAQAAQTIIDDAAEELFQDLTKTVDPSGLRIISAVDGKIGTIIDTTDDGAYKVAFGNAKRGEDVVETLMTKEQMKVIPKSQQMADEEILEKMGMKVANPATDLNPEAFKEKMEAFQTANIKAIKDNMKANLENPNWVAEGRVEGAVINYDYFDGPEGAAKMIKAYEDASMEVLQARVGTEGWHDVVIKGYNYMNEILGEPTGFIRDIKELGDGSLELAHKAYGIGNLITGLSNEVANISKLVLDPATTTPELKLKLIHRIQLMDETLQHYKAIKTGVARTLNSFKIPLGLSSKMNLEQLTGKLDEFGGQEFVDKLAARFANMSPKDASKLVAATKGNMFWAVNNELWINNVLSGIKTQVVNATSTLANAAMYPLSKMAGGMVTGDKALIEEGAKMYYAYGKFFTENVRMMAKAFKYGTNFLDSGASVFDKPLRAISSDFMKINNPYTAKFVDALGAVINLPSRGLMSVDEFFKQMTYRGELYGSLFNKGKQMGLQGAALEGYVNQGMQKAFSVVKVKSGVDAAGNDVFEEVLGKGVFKEALDVADEITFTTRLSKGSLTKKLSNATIQHPWMKMLVPFIKTPTNIIRTAGQYTPGVNMLMPSFKYAMEAGGKQRAMALGKMTVGSGLWASGIVLATQGMITGGGPKDPNKRAMLYEKGWQPYSFVTTDENGKKHYTSFSRIDPFASFFGMIGDYKDIAGQMDDMQRFDIATAMISSITKNLTSKTYLRGISETLEALNDPEMSLGKWLKRQAAAYVPLSSLMNDMTRAGDDEMKEAWSIMEHIKSRLPGFSDSVPIKYSWVTGNPVKIQEGLGPDFASPFATSETKGWVQEELARLNYGFTPPSKELKGVELTSEQYSKLCQLHGTVKIGGKTMMEALEHIMQTPQYDLKRERVDDSRRPDDMTDHRIRAIQKVIGAYRMAAARQLVMQDEGLRTNIYNQKFGKAAWKSGNPGKIEAFEQLQEMTE